MTLLRTPADIGATDFVHAKHNTAPNLAKAWNQHQAQNLDGYDVEGEHNPGALEISPNYFDPRAGAADATAPIPWNGFPRALDRWHKVLGNPTPAKQGLAEATADVVVEYLFWWEIGKKGKRAIRRIPAHLVGLLSPERQASARRARLGSGSGKELLMCYRQQDEYCEWHADHDDQGRLVRLSFTAEPPEYWTFLAEKEPELVLRLYKELVGPQVEAGDLFYPDSPVVYGVGKDGVAKWLPFAEKGEYNRYNKWNSTHGAVHLTHPANTLGAEINLAAQASLVYQSDKDGPDPTYDDDPALTRIACAGYGGVNRSSDPSIGEQVGIQVLAGKCVSLTDPVGLYVAKVDLSTLEREVKGQRVPVPEAQVLVVQRGDADAARPRKLHLTLQAPAGADWTLGDCFLDNRRLERGGQVARKITMVLYADVRNGGVDDTVNGCSNTVVCRHPDSAGFFGTFDPEDVPNCGEATAGDWAQEIPCERTSLAKDKLNPLAAKVHQPFNAAVGGGGRPCACRRRRACRSRDACRTRHLQEPRQAAMSMQEPLLDADDIQGHVLAGFGRAYELLLGLRLEPGRLDAAKTALRTIAAEVTPLRPAAQAKAMRRLEALAGNTPTAPASLSVAIALSGGGLIKLGADASKIADPIFQMGPGRSAAALGDDVDAGGRPQGWLFGDLPAREPDVLVVVASSLEAEVQASAERYLGLLGDTVTVLVRECGRRIARDAEHFGFVDGISQPGVRGRVDADTFLTPRAYVPDNPQGAMWARPGQRLTWPGQFVFGYPGLNPDAVQQPGEVVGEDPFLRNGSLLVVRRLSQDVALFWQAMTALAKQISAATGTAWTAPMAAARVVGRWQDGTPVSLSPDRENPDISGDYYRRNGFKFVTPVAAATLVDDGGDHPFPGAAADAQGNACPFFGHIRKVNPRDQSHDFGGAGSTLSSQMLRRGVPFGPDWPGAPDGADRGLMFMSYQTSIQHGFFRLMNEWVKDATRPIAGGIDPVIGPSPPGGRRLQLTLNDKQVTLDLDGQFVRATGAGYFFAPGLRTLRDLLA